MNSAGKRSTAKITENVGFRTKSWFSKFFDAVETFDTLHTNML